MTGGQDQQPAAAGLQPQAEHLVPRKTSRWRGSEKVHFHHHQRTTTSIRIIMMRRGGETKGEGAVGGGVQCTRALATPTPTLAVTIASTHTDKPLRLLGRRAVLGRVEARASQPLVTKVATAAAKARASQPLAGQRAALPAALTQDHNYLTATSPLPPRGTWCKSVARYGTAC